MSIRGFAVLLLLAAGTLSCGGDHGGGFPSPVTTPAVDEAALLDTTFRIDIETVQATLEVDPAARAGRGIASVAFRMRPGQTRPLVHFQAAAAGAVTGLRLDGQELDPAVDARVVSFPGSSQSAWEIQRDVSADALHQLDIAYPLVLPDTAGRFYTDVNDIQGRGNEGLWPTLNTPHELARHVVTLRVLSDRPYVAVGSGLVEPQPARRGVQEWVLDTERPVASYTVLFFLAPASDVVVDERVVNGVPVRVMAPVSGPRPDEAYAQLESWLPELEQALGPFPMPRGLSVVLTASGGGMEYFGGTVTSLRALRHEVFHMYYGTSTVLRTYRDSWLDEAVTVWYEASRDPAFAPIAETYRSGMVGSRSPIQVGFDLRAYDEGARIVQAVAIALGGRQSAIDFLREVHRDRSFDPFTTMDFVAMLRERRGVDMRARFEAWLFAPGAASVDAGAQTASPWQWLHEVDLTPPATGR